MAALDPAINRILYVTGRSDAYQSTPATITGNATEVYSYGLRIAHRTPIGWYVIDPSEALKPDGTKSVTTARHIRAAWEALR